MSPLLELVLQFTTETNVVLRIMGKSALLLVCKDVFKLFPAISAQEKGREAEAEVEEKSRVTQLSSKHAQFPFCPDVNLFRRSGAATGGDIHVGLRTYASIWPTWGSKVGRIWIDEDP
jgi:hypothetical protein